LFQDEIIEDTVNPVVAYRLRSRTPGASCVIWANPGRQWNSYINYDYGQFIEKEFQNRKS